MFARFLNYRVTLFFPLPLHTAAFGRQSLHAAHIQGVGIVVLFFEGGASIKLTWNSSAWEGCLFSPFVYSVMYYIIIDPYLHYTLSCNPILLSFLLKHFQLWLLFHFLLLLASCVLWSTPSLWSFVCFGISLLSDTIRCCWLIGYIFCLRSIGICTVEK